jgi:hypothetical protein
MTKPALWPGAGRLPDTLGLQTILWPGATQPTKGQSKEFKMISETQVELGVISIAAGALFLLVLIYLHHWWMTIKRWRARRQALKFNQFKPGAFQTLECSHGYLGNCPECLEDDAFVQVYGRDEVHQNWGEWE